MRFIPRHLAPLLTRDVNSTTFKNVLARLLQYISSTVFQHSIRGSSIRENVIRLVQPVTPHAPYFLNFNFSGKGESSPRILNSRLLLHSSRFLRFKWWIFQWTPERCLSSTRPFNANDFSSRSKWLEGGEYTAAKELREGVSRVGYLLNCDTTSFEPRNTSLQNQAKRERDR